MYRSNPVNLIKDIKKCFASVDENKLRHVIKKIDILKGVIVPHSNIKLSGPCAAWAYKAIELTGLPEILILLLPNHTGQLRKYPFCACKKSFRTPLGTVKVNKSFVNELAKRCGFNIFQEARAFLGEHALEIQLPFLQFIYRSAHKHPSIIPIICNLSGFQKRNKYPRELVYRFLNALMACIVANQKRTLIIASGDLHHQKRRRAAIYFHKKNKKIIQAMYRAEPKTLLNLRNEGIHSCCWYPFFSFLEILKPKRGFLLDYTWIGKANLFKNPQKKFRYNRARQIGFASIIF